MGRILAQMISRKELSTFLLFLCKLKNTVLWHYRQPPDLFSDKHFDYNRFGNLIVEKRGK